MDRLGDATAESVQNGAAQKDVAGDPVRQDRRKREARLKRDAAKELKSKGPRTADGASVREAGSKEAKELGNDDVADAKSARACIKQFIKKANQKARAKTRDEYSDRNIDATKKKLAAERRAARKAAQKASDDRDKANAALKDAKKKNEPGHPERTKAELASKRANADARNAQRDFEQSKKNLNPGANCLNKQSKSKSMKGDTLPPLEGKVPGFSGQPRTATDQGTKNKK